MAIPPLAALIGQTVIRLGSGVARPPRFRELTHFTIVTYGPFALREGVTAPRRSGVSPASAAPGGSDRTLLLECRLEQLRGALDEARAEADQARIRLAEALAREAGETQRLSVLQDELSRARAEVAALHRRLEHSEARRPISDGATAWGSAARPRYARSSSRRQRHRRCPLPRPPFPLPLLLRTIWSRHWRRRSTHRTRGSCSFGSAVVPGGGTTRFMPSGPGPRLKIRTFAPRPTSRSAGYSNGTRSGSSPTSAGGSPTRTRTCGGASCSPRPRRAASR